MQIAGWRRVPKLRARDYTLRDEIPGRKKKRAKEGERGRGGREDGISWTKAAQPILITRHVYRDPWNLDASVQRPPPPFSSYLNAFYYVRREEKGGSKRDYVGEGGK